MHSPCLSAGSIRFLGLPSSAWGVFLPCGRPTGPSCPDPYGVPRSALSRRGRGRVSPVLRGTGVRSPRGSGLAPASASQPMSLLHRLGQPRFGESAITQPRMELHFRLPFSTFSLPGVEAATARPLGLCLSLRPPRYRATPRETGNGLEHKPRDLRSRSYEQCDLVSHKTRCHRSKANVPGCASG
jgi:hypothetical protein